MGEMRVMDVQAGDLKVIWDRDNEEEVAAARDQFTRMVKKKKSHFAYKVKGDGAKGEKIEEFDPDAEKIIIAPIMQGG